MRTPIGAESPKPSPPIAALRNPSGRRAGMRACSSGRLDGDSSTSTTSSGSRSASAASTWPARSGSPGPGGAGGSGRANPGGRRTRTRRDRRAPAPRTPPPARPAAPARRGCGAPRPGRRSRARSGCPRPRTARARTGTGGTPPPPPPARGRGRPAPRAPRRAPAGRWPANSGWSCGKPARAAERLLPDRAAELLRQLHQRRPRVGESAPAPTTSAGERASSTIPASSATASGAAARPPSTRTGAAGSRSDSAGSSQSSIGTITSAGPRAQARLVPRPRHRRRHVLRARRLLDRHRVVPGQPLQPPGEERLVRQVAAVLLAHDHHQRRAIHPRRGQRGHRVAEPGRGVHEHEGGLAAADRVAATPGRRPTPRAAPARSGSRPAWRPGTTPRSSPGWRRSWSSRARA